MRITVQKRELKSILGAIQKHAKSTPVAIEIKGQEIELFHKATQKRVTVQKRELESVLEATRNPAKITPILIETKGQEICLHCNAVHLKITKHMDGRIEKQGRAVVEVETLHKTTQEAETEITLDAPDKSSLNVISGSTHATLDQYDHQYYEGTLDSSTAIERTPAVASITSTQLKNGLKMTAHARQRNTARISQHGTQIAFNGTQVRFRTTDGHRMAEWIEDSGEEFANPDKKRFDESTFIPYEEGNLTTALLPFIEGTIHLHKAGNRYAISSDRCWITGRDNGATFPNVDAVMPKPHNFAIRLKNKEFLSIVKAIWKNTKAAEDHAARLDVKEGEALTLSSSKRESNISRTLEYEAEGWEYLKDRTLTLGFNAKYMKESITDLKTNEITLLFHIGNNNYPGLETHVMNPFKIAPETLPYTAVMMPQRINY